MGPPPLPPGPAGPHRASLPRRAWPTYPRLGPLGINQGTKKPTKPQNTLITMRGTVRPLYAMVPRWSCQPRPGRLTLVPPGGVNTGPRDQRARRPASRAPRDSRARLRPSPARETAPCPHLVGLGVTAPLRDVTHPRAKGQVTRDSTEFSG